jgi:hypothetical protein
VKLPNLRMLAVGAASVAMAVGISATAASAATAAPAAHTARAAATAPVAGKITSVVTGTFTNSAGQGTFTGTFTPTKFAVVNGVLQATGVLKGKLVDANGNQIGTVDQTVTDNVVTNAANGATRNAVNAPSCSVLNLTLGPLNLNLLGLVVTLNQVHLTITAVPGAGNLLGNLLCAVANLLNGGTGLSGLLTELSTLLNQILAAL